MLKAKLVVTPVASSWVSAAKTWRASVTAAVCDLLEEAAAPASTAASIADCIWVRVLAAMP